MSQDLTRWSLMDEKLLQAAASGKSGAQMEAELDIPAAQAIVRVRELLRSRDIWSEMERKQLLLEDMYALKDKFAKNIDMTDAKHVEALTKLLERIGIRLDAMSQVNSEQVERMTMVQAQKLLQLFMTATERAKDILSEAYPGAVLDDIDAALQEGLREAAAEIEGVQ